MFMSRLGGGKNLEFKKGRASKGVRNVIGVDEGGFSPETRWCRHRPHVCDRVTRRFQTQ